MNRRTALKTFALVAGAAALLPACSHPPAELPASVPLRHLAVNARQEKTLAEVCETILPKTDTPGAKDLSVHLYVLKMLDDCSSPDEQRAFQAGLGQLDEAAQQRHAQPFLGCSPAQRLALLQGVEQGKGFPSDLVSFYKTAKRLTVSGYTGSKYFLTQQIVYELVPSRYNGYFPIKDVNLSKSHHGQS
ncbi:gluconate 2-dehydrogenase subunit 3 family protein [Hymenobacter nivis]|uniref:Gluconate 2-dehydrogenase subunit 3 family protein n=1 Tax=Hymenobacter nivis TaxID=1850093 RepID=A0A2Z3GFR8_9BACT|nr:gluconate 2-dehydrogenase subunit 3 family protein [Hymenobacter nivis]AWM32589.1 hypothetical protein DDQ68_07210 [Hymenobacter nivis]